MGGEGGSVRTVNLVAASRELLFERGSLGFTVQDVTDRAGTSRRTFFNHFASKEHAVLGVSVLIPPDLGEAEFLQSRSDLGTGLLEALGALFVRRMSAYVGTAAEFADLQRALALEPRLRQVLQDLLLQRSQADVHLVEQWLGVTGDPHAPLAVSLVTAMMQRVLERRPRTGSRGPFDAAFTHELSLLREVAAARGSGR